MRSALWLVVSMCVFSLGAGVTVPALAAGETGPAASIHKGEGTVHRVDAAAGKLNMTHGPIKSLKWPGMTMDFRVKDKAVLTGIKPGQQVEFDLEKSDSQYVITRITPARK
ncbi:MAG TPA: copper-binding protein [Acidiferrobacterales bacterium]|nr:copper-binding protein [Acidiferrobacterales bacterium]